MAESFQIQNITNFVSLKLDFDKNNYLLWKNQFLPILICNNLDGYLDNTKPAPLKTIADVDRNLVINPAYAKWRRTDQYILCCINATLSKNTAKDAWITIEILFQQQTQALLSSLRKKLCEAREDTSSIIEYLNKIKSAADALAAINHPVPDTDLTTYVLNGLPVQEYHPFITSIENCTTPPTFTNLRSKLLVYEEERLHSTQSTATITAPGDHTALLSQRGPPCHNQRGRDQRYHRNGSQGNNGSYSHNGFRSSNGGRPNQPHQPQPDSENSNNRPLLHGVRFAQSLATLLETAGSASILLTNVNVAP